MSTAADKVDPDSWALPPVILSDPDAAEWFAQADVVVVGVGGAGVTAALQARESGADVIALDRFQSGGSTAWSGGVYYGGATRYQREAGVEDTPENMFAYLKQELRGSVSDATLMRFCQDSSDNLDWLVSHGAQFNSNLTTTKTYFPDRGFYLYFSGNERLPEYAAITPPAPRGHRAYAEGDPAGNTGWALFPPLKKSMLENGVRLIPHAAVDRLIVDGTGRVIGVEALVIEDAGEIAQHAELYDKSKPAPFNDKTIAKARVAVRDIEVRAGVRRRIRARGGVILTTGGFEVNPKMLAQESSTDFSKALALGMLGSDGAGITLGRSVGGATAHMNHTFYGIRIVPPQAYLKGMLIGRKGRRMISEEAYLSTIGYVMAQDSDGDAWVVVDGKLLRSAMRDTLRGPSKAYGMAALLNILIGGTRRARTIEGLARKLGVNEAAIRETLDTYNQAARGEIDDPLGKPHQYIQEMARGPYYAVNVSISNRLQFVSVFTLGGLTVDEESGQVLGDDSKPVPGLYAAGRAAVGLPSISYVSGMSISDCVFSGRRAGRSAAGQR